MRRKNKKGVAEKQIIFYMLLNEVSMTVLQIKA